MNLRPYQVDGIAACLASLQESGRGLLVWATGLGKTVAFANLAKEYADRGKRVLVIAHREELLSQARKKITDWTGLRTGLERAQDAALRETRRTIYGDEEPEPVVVASVQSISQPGRYESFRDGFGLVIVDEAHHATAGTYRRVIDHYRARGSHLIGVTATPDRLDEASLVEIFGPPSHVYELPEAIKDGWLAKVLPRLVRVTSMDFSRVRKVAGDFNAGELEEILVEEEQIQAVADATVQHHEGRQTLMFAVSVDQALRLADNLNRRDAGRAEMVHGGTPPEERAKIFARFHSHETRFLTNVGIATEGWDEPHVGCVVMARPTMSRALHAQCVGRGTRLAPDIGKTDCIVLDFVDNSLRHELVCSLDLFAGEVTDAVLDRAKALAMDGATADAETAIRAAEAEEADRIQRARDKEKEQADRIAEALDARREIVGRAATEIMAIDAFSVLGVTPKERSRRWGGLPATASQQDALRRFKLDESQVRSLDKGQASALLDALVTRAKRGLATYKQTQQLRKRGLPTNVRFETARRWLDAIAANRWQVPDSIYREISEHRAKRRAADAPPPETQSTFDRSASHE